MKRAVLLLMAVVATLFTPISALAQAQPIERGLAITPPRQYLEINPGKSTKSSITIANLTENGVNVTFTVQQFSVADYTYDYSFQAPKEDWVKLETSTASLKKTESRAISYEIAVPNNATPGGHYFTVLASMSPQEGKVVQAATIIYVAVGGELVKANKVEENSLPVISFGGDIPFKVDVRNTGNTHFFVYLSGKLNGLSAQSPQAEIAHLLLPQTVRRVEGGIISPLLPGIYQAEYGFKDENGRQTIFRQHIMYAPPWSLALLIGVIWFTVIWYRRRRHLALKSTTDS